MSTTEDKNTFMIIGAGYGRTGTTSLQAALNKLGYPCHHMNRSIFKGEDQTKFIKMAKKKLALKQQQNITSYDNWSKIQLSETDINELCRTVLYHDKDKNKLLYRACVDWPFCIYYQELMHKYPNAKIILTVRDSSSKWYDSMMATVFPLCMVAYKRWFANLFPFIYRQNKLAKYGIYGISFDCYSYNDQFGVDKEYGCNKYEEWNESVEKYVNEQNRDLLIFNVKDGWKPLCEFLDIKDEDIPNEPFPFANERSLISSSIKIINGVCDFVNVAIVAVVGYYGYKYWLKQQ